VKAKAKEVWWLWWLEQVAKAMVSHHPNMLGNPSQLLSPDL
jgi:hypothetical protein